MEVKSTFIKGSRNLKSSAVNEHTQSKLHKQALQLEEQDQARVENRRARVIQQKPPSDSGILQAINNMGRLSEEENKGLKKLFDIAYLIAFKARPYSDFSDLVELEKLHGVRNHFFRLVHTRMIWHVNFLFTTLQNPSMKKS